MLSNATNQPKSTVELGYMCPRGLLGPPLTFAPRFANIHTVLDSVEFWENSVVILAKFSSSCVYMLSLSYFFVVFRF